ncbi:MAG: MFS transporter [Chloroflexi bacterium]|nr:MFS transporter [Chloroflexota bacterium]
MIAHAPFQNLDSRRRWAILGAVMLGLFLSAMDQTIVGTAMPRIIAELSGLKLYAWVFTSYMLASTTSVPIVGKMGDIYGRKNFFLVGIVVFLIGSVLSGMSQTMLQLILFRGVQGLGGGMIFANAFAIIGDLYPPAERGKYAGLMSGVFGLASVIGPLVGGYITDNLSWRWVFYVNIPLGALALFVLATVLPAHAKIGVGRKLDYWGAVALALAIAPLLLGFSWAGTDYAWGSPQVVLSFAFAAIMAGIFWLVERRAEEPVIPFSLFRSGIFAVATAITFVTGAAMFSGSVYIPLFMQGVLGFSATNSGLVMMPMTLSMVCGSMISGQVVSRTGKYKWMSVGGLAIATGGLYILSAMTVNSSQFVGMTGMAVLGFGLGTSFTPLVLSVQNSVPYSMMGVTTSLNTFARSVGGTIGVAIMGSFLTRRLNDELAAGLPAQVQEQAPAPLLEGLKNPRILLDDAALARVRDEGFGPVFGADATRLFEATIASMERALATSITEIFLIATVLMAAGFVLAFFLREAPLRTTNAPVIEAEETDGAIPLAASRAPHPRPAAEHAATAESPPGIAS